MEIIRWSETTPPTEHLLHKKMQVQGLSPYFWSNAPGDTYATHSHSYEKVLYCTRGSIRFAFPDEPDGQPFVDLAPGDCMILPPGVRHSAVVGPQGVSCLEATRAASRPSAFSE